MTRFYFYLLAGYLSGSVLYAHIWGRFLCRKDVTAGTRDGNPGTANAFMVGGFWCGILTLLCDLAKGFVPVWLFLRQTDSTDFVLAFVLAAPVIGHIFPLFHHFRGGKGIATSFGCLLGLRVDSCRLLYRLFYGSGNLAALLSDAGSLSRRINHYLPDRENISHSLGHAADFGRCFLQAPDMP